MSIEQTLEQTFEARWRAWQLRGQQGDQRREDLLRVIAVLITVAGGAALLFGAL